MPAVQALLQANAAQALALGGLIIGLAFGFVAQRANFCVMGAISDWRTFGSAGRLGAVALAAAVGIAGAQALAASGLIDLSRSMYLAPRLNWAGSVFGGLLFGAGMVYAGGCASRNVIRAGAGDMRALLVILTLAVAAFATISGVLAPLRDALEQATALELAGDSSAISLDALWRRWGLADASARACAAGLLLIPLLAFAFLRGGLARDFSNLAAGIGVGLLVAAGWLLSGLTYDEMALRPLAPQSLSFVRPTGDAIDYLQRSTALGWPGFGAASVFGTLLGSALAAALSKSLRITGFAGRDDVVRHVFGALAMGIGGVLALGCSIGQGLTGVSTLSLQSLLSAAAIFTGAHIALARLERGV